MLGATTTSHAIGTHGFGGGSKTLQQTLSATSATSHGTLHLIIGPMFSGKSTQLLHAINSYLAIGKKVLVVNHALNTRYNALHERGSGVATHACGVTTHDGNSDRKSTGGNKHVVVLDDLRHLYTHHSNLALLDAVDVVCIEELQFFDDTYETLRYVVDTLEKHVVCAGLIADYKREPFGDVLRLIPLADELTHLKALCTVCNDGTAAIFTQRQSAATGQVHIGERESYRAVCRRHYLQLCRHAQHTVTSTDTDADADADANANANAARETYEDGGEPNPTTSAEEGGASLQPRPITRDASGYAVGYGYDDVSDTENNASPTSSAVPWYVSDVDPDYADDDYLCSVGSGHG